MYVTLEPCCHHGRQPPCTDAILEAGIRRVVVGSGDPNPLVAGKGLDILRGHGVEVETGDCGPVPEGFDVITLPTAEYLVFQGEPFREEDYCEAITAVQNAADKYDPALIGYRWDDSQPRIQLEPRGERGYIELRPVRPLGTT